MIDKIQPKIMTQPFYFSNGQLAHNADDLLQLCQQFPDDGTNYLVREDLEKWLSYIGKDGIAQCATNARQTALEDSQKLGEFFNKCHKLSSSAIEYSAFETFTDSEAAKDTDVAEIESEATSEPQQVDAVKESENKEQEPSVSPTSNGRKPSFFKIIARLIVNVLYRQKN